MFDSAIEDPYVDHQRDLAYNVLTCNLDLARSVRTAHRTYMHAHDVGWGGSEGQCHHVICVYIYDMLGYMQAGGEEEDFFSLIRPAIRRDLF